MSVTTWKASRRWKIDVVKDDSGGMGEGNAVLYEAGKVRRGEFPVISDWGEVDPRKDTTNMVGGMLQDGIKHFRIFFNKEGKLQGDIFTLSKLHSEDEDPGETYSGTWTASEGDRDHPIGPDRPKDPPQ